jgi:hypothetical protein
MAGETRGNLAAGGAAWMPPRRRARHRRTPGPILWARGLLIVGLDLIGDRLTEINVTSPTCMVEITAQTGFDVPGAVIDALEGHAPDHRLTFWLLAIGLALLLAGCQRERLHQQESYVFGTRVEVITWDAPSRKPLRRRGAARVRPPAPGLPRLGALRTHRPQHGHRRGHPTDPGIARSWPPCSPTPRPSPPPATNCSTRPSAS